MKNRSYANRGQPFEEYIRFANSYYAKDRLAIIEKLPTEFIPLRNARGQVCNVKVERKSKVDFIGRFKHYPIAIEAKNTNEDSIRFDRVEPHQADCMDAFTAQQGTIGLVLVSFNLERFFAIPWAFWGYAYDLRVRRNDRSTAVNLHAFGQEWDVPTKYSVRIDELNHEWEIPSCGTAYGLDYLRNAEKYITKPEST